MLYIILVLLLINLYFSIKRFDMVFITTLKRVCISTVVNSLLLIFVILAMLIELLSGTNVLICIIGSITALLTVVFDSLTINKYVKLKTKEEDESNVFKR